MNGELAGKLASIVSNTLNEGASLGYNSLTLTAYRCVRHRCGSSASRHV